MIDHLILKPGERGIYIGQTGSGKTRGAMYQLQQNPIWPIIVFDTKGENAFEELPLNKDESIEIIDSMADFIKKWPRKIVADYTIVRPDGDEMATPFGIMNDGLRKIERQAMPCLLYFDELYQWHEGGRAGSGLIGILTRGRSKGIATAMSTQRPSFVSRFCFTESQKFFFYKLQDKRDKKTIGEFVPGADELRFEKPFSWFFSDNSAYGKGIQAMKPVPILEFIGDAENVVDAAKIFI